MLSDMDNAYMLVNHVLYCEAIDHYTLLNPIMPHCPTVDHSDPYGAHKDSTL
jgi:hypothetical protein